MWLDIGFFPSPSVSTIWAVVCLMISQIAQILCSPGLDKQVDFTYGIDHLLNLTMKWAKIQSWLLLWWASIRLLDRSLTAEVNASKGFLNVLQTGSISILLWFTFFLANLWIDSLRGGDNCSCASRSIHCYATRSTEMTCPFHYNRYSATNWPELREGTHVLVRIWLDWYSFVY